MNAKHLKRTLALVLIMVIMVSFSSAAFAHEASSVRKTFTIVRTQPANQILGQNPITMKRWNQATFITEAFL